MHIFHKWSKWEPYTEKGTRTYTGILIPSDLRGKPIEYTERRQKRQCLKCGLEQDEEVRASDGTAR
jgi:hypothetical protein